MTETRRGGCWCKDQADERRKEGMLLQSLKEESRETAEKQLSRRWHEDPMLWLLSPLTERPRERELGSRNRGKGSCRLFWLSVLCSDPREREREQERRKGCGAAG
ncbi:hypothetical protein CDL15_Pgr018402 [Punica granatum]|uniref:Uncharacterized protein n=1 Tax=Punica granatum TaxID=22663 RepID=A0A218W2Y4_PUNGR|nr:hypothetical protein CDL15_Pgr018402 [Punica granatum]